MWPHGSHVRRLRTVHVHGAKGKRDRLRSRLHKNCALRLSRFLLPPEDLVKMPRRSSILSLFCGFAFLTLSCATLVSAQQDQTTTPAQGAAPAVKSPPKAPTDAKTSSSPTGPAYPVFDVMSAKFTSQDACLLFDPEVLKDKAKSRIERLRTEIEYIQSDGTISGWS